MGFRDPIIGGGGELVRERMRSANYVAGVAGWQIERDGDAEFNDVTVRGDLLVKNGNRELELNVATGPPYDGSPHMRLNPDVTSTADGVILAAVDEFSGQASLIFVSPYPDGGDTTNAAQLIMYSDLGDLSGGSLARLVAEAISLEADTRIDLTAPSVVVSLGAGGVLSLPDQGSYVKRGGIATVPAAGSGSPTAYQAGWSNLGGSFQVGGYIELPDHTGMLVGIAAKAVPVSGETIFTLPSQMRPAANHVFTAACTGGREGQIQVASDGSVIIQGFDAGTTWISMSGCQWPIDGL